MIDNDLLNDKKISFGKTPKASNGDGRSSAFSLLFLRAILDIMKNEWEDNTSVSGSSASERDRKFKDFVNTRLLRSFNILESKVDEFITDEIRYDYPDPEHRLAKYTSKSGNEYPANLNYFEQMNKAWASSYSGTRTRTYEVIRKCDSALSGCNSRGSFPRFQIGLCLVYALALLFIAGTLSPYVPDMMPLWLHGDNPTMAILITAGVIIGGSFLLWCCTYDEPGLVGKLGKLSFLHFFGSIAVSVMIYLEQPGRIDPGYLEALALFSGIASVLGIIDGFLNKGRAARRRKTSRAEFCHIWERERKHFDNYIKFHDEWWFRRGEGTDKPAFLTKMRSEYERMEAQYKRHS